MKNKIENDPQLQEFFQLKSFRDYWINTLTNDQPDESKVMACEVIINRNERMKSCLRNIQCNPEYSQRELEDINRLDTLIRVIKKRFAQ